MAMFGRRLLNGGREMQVEYETRNSSDEIGEHCRLSASEPLNCCQTSPPLIPYTQFPHNVNLSHRYYTQLSP